MEKSLSVIGQEAQEQHNKILHLKKMMSVGFLVLGKELRKMKMDNSWKFITGEDSQWKDYCTQELGMNRDYCNVLINIYDTFILNLKFKEQDIAPVDQRKLIAILPHSKDRETAEELIEKAKALSRSDLMLELHQINHDPEDCAHQPKEVHYWYCTSCKEKLTLNEVKIYGRK